MNMYCDRYSVCNAMLVDQTEDRARAKGWAIWEGTTMAGKQTRVVLCPRCVDAHRRRLDPHPVPLPGDQSLFELVVRVDPGRAQP